MRQSPEITPLERAVELLGAEKVITADQWSKAWNREVMETEAGILKFSEDILRDAARTNEDGISDYRLVYCGGVSLREQRDYFGIDTKNQPCYYADSDWWLDEDNEQWVKHQPKSGYRLFDYKPYLRQMTWQTQEDVIARRGTGFSRAHETDVAEGCLSFYMVHQGERLLEDTYHLGRFIDSDGMRICVGSFDFDGLVIDRSVPNESYYDTGVVVERS